MNTFENIFSIPIYRTNIIDGCVAQLDAGINFFNQEHKRDLANGKNIHTGWSNTGWHSRSFDYHTKIDAVKGLFEVVRSEIIIFLDKLICCEHNSRVVEKIELHHEATGWAVINASGDSNHTHIHTSIYRDTYAAVLYLRVPTQMSGGELRFSNPDLGFRSSIGTTLAQFGRKSMYTKIAPRVGDLVIFPGTLPHDVLPFYCDKGNETRLVFACNFGISGMKVWTREDGSRKIYSVY